MFFGLLLFVLTKKKNLGLAGTIVPNPLSPAERKRTALVVIIALIVIGAALIFMIPRGWVTIDSFVTFIGILGILIPICYFVTMYFSSKTSTVERSRLLAYIPLFVAGVMFWAIQEQGATILAAYADNRTDLSIGGFSISPAWFQSLNPLFIITLSPLFALLWTKLGNRQPTIPKKFSIGLVFAGLSFVVILIPGTLAGENALVNPLWLVLSYFVVVLGELCISPVGLSATTKLAPTAFSAQTMSLWFLTNAAAQALNASIVDLYTPETETLYFGIIGGASIVLGILLFLIAPVIQRAMKGIR
jgi:POT family proton-dependent oligopeptide transporter